MDTKGLAPADTLFGIIGFIGSAFLFPFQIIQFVLDIIFSPFNALFDLFQGL